METVALTWLPIEATHLSRLVLTFMLRMQEQNCGGSMEANRWAE